jgi:zinc protease
MKMSLLCRKTRGGTVVANVTIRYGDEKSLAGKSAIAGITGGLLMRGTKNKTRQQIQDEIDRLKAQLSVSGSPTSATARIETIEANLPGALRLAAEILREPAFPDNEFETVRQRRISATAEAGRSDPSSPRAHRVSAPYEPLPARRRPLRLHFRRADWGPQRRSRSMMSANSTSSSTARASEIAVSGRFAAPEITKLATELFGNWKSPAPTRASPTCSRKSRQRIRRSRPPTSRTPFSSPAR